MMKHYLKFIINLFLATIFIFLSGLACAGSNGPDLGIVADNLFQSVIVMSDFVQSACFVIGGSFLFTSIIKYYEHRRSPLLVPISTVIFLLIAGIILILLPFLSYIVDNGVPIH